MAEATTYYIVLTSKDSLQFFPTNTGTQFTAVLDTPLTLTDRWDVGLKQILVELQSPAPTKELVVFDVFLRQASGCILGGVESMLLRRLFVWVMQGDHPVTSSFESCDFVPVRLPYLDRLEIMLKLVNPTHLSFNSQATTHATLVLAKQ